MKIGDFGLVKAESLPSLEMDEEALKSYRSGTPTYMSPEQHATREKSPLTTKVDIYALGIILFELLHRFDTGMERKAVSG